MNARKLVKKRTVLSNKETATFIAVWRNKISELRSSRKNSYVLQEMSDELAEKNYIFLSVEEVRTRINNLKKRFRREKLLENSDGVQSEWEFFSVINEFIGSFKPDELMTDFKEESVLSTDSDLLNCNTYSPELAMLWDHQTSTPVPPLTTKPSAVGAVPIDAVSTEASSQKNSSQIPGLASPISSRHKNKRDAMCERLLQLAEEEAEVFKNFVQQSKANEEKRNDLLRQNIDIQKQLLEYFMKNNN